MPPARAGTRRSLGRACPPAAAPADAYPAAMTTHEPTTDRTRDVLRSLDELRGLVLLCLVVACWTVPVARSSTSTGAGGAETTIDRHLSLAPLVKELWDLRRGVDPSSPLDQSGLAIGAATLLLVALALVSARCLLSIAVPGRSHGILSTLTGLVMVGAALVCASVVAEATYARNVTLSSTWGFACLVAAGAYLVARPSDPLADREIPSGHGSREVSPPPPPE